MRNNTKRLILTALVCIFVISLCMTAFACDNKNGYTITFYDDNQVIHTITTSGNATITLPQAEEKPGYTFEGWYLDKDTWQEKLTSDFFATKPISQNIKVYAYYKPVSTPEPQKYTITFYDNDKVIDSVLTAGNEVISLPTAPDKDGYNFKGYYFDKGTWQDQLTANTYADKPLESNVDVYAYYKLIPTPEPQEYTITFYDNDKVIDSILTAGNEVINLPNAPDKEGYSFEGYFFDKDTWQDQLTANTYADKPLENNVDVYAYYKLIPTPEPQEYTITFYDNDRVIDSILTAGNEVISLPTPPQKDNYEFIGWYLDKDVWQTKFDENYFVGQPLTDNLSVYAYYKYIQPTYTITFDTNDGSYVNSMKVSVIETSPSTTKKGYTFDGWYEDKLFTQKVEFPYYPTKDTTLYAKWIAQSAQINIDSNGNVTGYTGVLDDGKLVIPAYIDGVKVKGIAAYAFRDNKEIKSLEVDDSILSLGTGSFWRCYNLKSVKISDKITYLPDNVFSDCSSLTDINLPSSLVEMRSNALSGTAIASIVLPDSVKEIWQEVFANCKSLTNIDLGNVTYIGRAAFQNCTALQSITIPDTINKLTDHNIFYGCTALNNIVFPDKELIFEYSIIDNTAYYNNQSNWENGVLYLGKHLIKTNEAFKNTQNYTVKQGTINIASNAFRYNNQALKSVVLPQGLLSIGSKAFADCYALTSLNIPQSVVQIGADSISGTPLIKSNQSTYIDGWLLAYHYEYGQTSIVIEEGTVGIADGQLTSSSYNITDITLPSTLKYIGDENFKYCNFTSIVLPKGLKRIGYYAFFGCSSVTDMDLSQCDQLEVIEEYAFTGCKGIKSFYICRSVTTLGEGVFNQIPGVVVNFEINEDEIPDGWDKDWDFTYASVPVIVNWGVAKP